MPLFRKKFYEVKTGVQLRRYLEIEGRELEGELEVPWVSSAKDISDPWAAYNYVTGTFSLRSPEDSDNASVVRFYPEAENMDEYCGTRDIEDADVGIYALAYVLSKKRLDRLAGNY